MKRRNKEKKKRRKSKEEMRKGIKKRFKFKITNEKMK